MRELDSQTPTSALRAGRAVAGLEVSFHSAPTRLAPADDSATPVGPSAHDTRHALDMEPAPAAAPAPVEVLPRIEGFAFVRLVGRGGMGTVYEATQAAFENRTVAVKLLDPVPAGMMRRFRQEVKAHAALRQHTHVVPVYSWGEWEGRPYLVMAFMPGGTLADRLDRLAGDAAAVADLMARVARAVDAMHAAGILHRDLKPANILIDAAGEPRVADLGLAHFLAGEGTALTAAGGAVGTPEYMSPEQAAGRRDEYTFRSDVYSLGAMLYELLTGSRPFPKEGAASGWVARVGGDRPPRFAARRAGLPPALEAVTFKCLARRPGDRYTSAGQLADELDRYVAGQPVAAPKPPSRTPRRAAAVGATLLGLCAAMVSLSFEKGKRTVAERLAAGETVELVPAKGLPTVPTSPLPGREGMFELNGDGFLALNAASFKAVGFDIGDLPAPFRLEVEYAVTRCNPTLSNSGGGIFARTFTASLGDRNRHAMLRFFQREDADAGAVQGDVELRGWRTPAGPENHFCIERRTQPLPPQQRAPTWHKVAFDCLGTATEVRWDGVPYPRLPNGRLDADLNGPALFGPPPALEIHWADATCPPLGLCVDNGEALFRNVRLVPLVP